MPRLVLLCFGVVLITTGVRYRGEWQCANGYDVWHARPKGYFSNIVAVG